MNPTSTDPTAPPPQPQPPRSSFSCDRHPTEQFTGFCPSCLCERLTTLDSSSNTPSSSRRPSSASAAAAAAIKSLFSSSTTASKANNFPPPPPAPKPSKPTSFFPELRRTKSFSASKNEALGLFFEPQRKSCDVRVRNTLWSLFTLENENKPGLSNNKPSTSAPPHQNLQNSQKIESSVSHKPVFEETENEEDFGDPENVEDGVAVYDEYNSGDGDEITSVHEPHPDNLRNVVEIEANCREIVEEEEVASVSNTLKSMKDHIDLDSQEKKSSGGGFWAAASVFSKKWHKWRRKQKIKKQNDATLPVEKPISRQYRETQSEIADYGFGRRSCDTDPRFSLDAGRISLDDPRYSFDEPRASWDGYLIGRSFPRMAAPPMVSVMEDPPLLHVSRTDMQIPVEEQIIRNNEGDGGGGGGFVPGGSMQTKEYYSDSSSRRKKSLDRSSSIRKTAASVVAEIDELKMVSNAKVSPTTADYFQGAKVMDSNSNSLRDDCDCSETFELGSCGIIRDSSNNGDNSRKDSKKSRRWSWRIWGFIQRRSNNINNKSNKDEDDDEKCSSVNGVERSLSESWTNGNGDVRNMGFNRNMFRSNSSVSWRNGGSNNNILGSFGSMRKSSVETNGKKRRDDFVLEKNRSGRYSPPPNNVDNGLLRFYLTPMSRSSSRRGQNGKFKPNNSHSIARSVLRLY